jgi:hypothetical protein
VVRITPERQLQKMVGARGAPAEAGGAQIPAR